MDGTLRKAAGPRPSLGRRVKAETLRKAEEKAVEAKAKRKDKIWVRFLTATLIFGAIIALVFAAGKDTMHSSVTAASITGRT